MNNLELWYKNNEQYLMAAIAWLQLRLLKLANSLDNTDQLDQAYAAMTVAAAAQPPPALVIKKMGLKPRHKLDGFLPE
jgi:hypothetical protein